MLGIMTTYPLRDTRWLFIPVPRLNATIVASALILGATNIGNVLAGAGFYFHRRSLRSALNRNSRRFTPRVKRRPTVDPLISIASTKAENFGRELTAA